MLNSRFLKIEKIIKQEVFEQIENEIESIKNKKSKLLILKCNRRSECTKCQCQARKTKQRQVLVCTWHTYSRFVFGAGAFSRLPKSVPE